MPSLRKLQQGLIESVLADDDGRILPWIGEHGVPAAQRLGVYRNNCRENFLAALSTGYPVLRRLTGAAYFRQLVREYQHDCPSPSGNLFHAGERLPGYLAERFAGTEFAYFTDVARLEWLCQEVLPAAGHAPLDLRRLAGASPEDYPRLCFELDPAARLFASRYPAVTIWEAHQQDGEPQQINLASGGEQAIVQRRHAGVTVCRLTPAEYACLAALGDGLPLASALEEGLRTDPSFDLQATLRRSVEAGLIADFSLPGDPGGV